MPTLKTTYFYGAKLCRFTSKILDNWFVVLLAVCIVSPISPHVRLSSADLYPSCAYGGVRGIIYEYDRANCPVIALVDTRGRGQW